MRGRTEPEPSQPSAAGGLIDRLARRYSAALSRYFERRVAHPADVPDLMQDVFLRLSRLENSGGIERPESYLFATAASALKDRARRDAARMRQAHESFDDSAHGGSDFSPARVLEGRQGVERLQQALTELPERTRDAFVLRVFEEQKMAEVARCLGISVRAAEKHCAKALAHVARALEDWRHS